MNRDAIQKRERTSEMNGSDVDYYKRLHISRSLAHEQSNIAMEVVMA